jgi:hypothetical protein
MSSPKNWGKNDIRKRATLDSPRLPFHLFGTYPCWGGARPKVKPECDKAAIAIYKKLARWSHFNDEDAAKRSEITDYICDYIAGEIKHLANLPTSESQPEPNEP